MRNNFYDPTGTSLTLFNPVRLGIKINSPI